MKKKIVMLIFLIIPLFTIAQKQFIYRSVSKGFVRYTSVDVSKYLISANKIEQYLPKGYSRQGNIDYTTYVQKAIDEKAVVVLPNFPILINQTGLKLRSNTTLVFQKNSRLKMLPNDKSNYSILSVSDVKNVLIINPRLEGDKKLHKSNKGEWGMGINILGSENVKIYNPEVLSCWGDGIYIGRTNKNSASKNIVIQGGLLDNNRRNGISVISVQGLTISDITIANTQGTAPMSGIDFEPNYADEVLQGIKLNRMTTINNGFDGMRVVLMNLKGSTSNVDIAVDRHRDYYTYMPVSFFGVKNNPERGGTVNGSIQYRNAEWHENDVSLGEYFDLNLPLQIKMNNVLINKGNSRKKLSKNPKDLKNKSIFIGN